MATMTLDKITPCLWFDKDGEKAARFYCSLFDDSEILHVSYYGEAGPGPEGEVLTVEFRLAGQTFMALNGGPHYTPSPAVSFSVGCQDQAEVDRLWDTILEHGGQVQECGWITDPFGFSWQIVPIELGEMLKDPDRERATRVMKALLGMVKLDLAELRRAYQG